jgi:hypothetical protein
MDLRKKQQLYLKQVTVTTSMRAACAAQLRQQHATATAAGYEADRLSETVPAAQRKLVHGIRFSSTLLASYSDR